MKAVFWLVVMALTQISRLRLRFKQSRISLLIPHIYVLGRFVIFFSGDFKVDLELNGFPQRISKIYGNRNFEDLVLF